MAAFDRIDGIADGIGRALMGLAGIAAGFALIEALWSLGSVPAETLWIELWRALGYGVFSLLYFMLALRPRRAAGIWEVSFFHKAALGVSALFIADNAEAAAAGPVDAGLAAATLVAYGLTRGWRSWQS
ncbi:hypothetical protein SAMN05216456_2750 [Devosia crocina]|uniref:Uncharacterized protein n=1 Tax=Devosia crocina TaxID=429728 RepID=A0A1I7NR53_9HYPH|nr:hypothetical protein [Devosia crocina]SFV37103.1 hypothetical protein SAMN05216456_2750 [Devosia crocina]